MSVAKSLFLGLLLLAVAYKAQLAADPNPQATDVQNKRDYWCGISNPWDRRYNTSQQIYYRMNRQTLYGDNYQDAFGFYANGGSTTWIQTQRWATGLLLVIICLSFISWMIWLGFCCAPPEKNRSVVFMRLCTILAWTLFVLFLGLFVIIMIFIAFSEVSQRRSKCQALNVGSMLINGYRSQFNGNQYVGLMQYSRILNNLKAETPNLLQVVPSAQSILSSTSQYWASSAYSSLNSVYAANWQKTTVGALRETTQGNFISDLTPGITNPIGEDVGRLYATANNLNGAAQAIPNLGNNGFQTTVLQTIGYLNANVNSMIADLSDFSLIVWNKAWSRYTYATGGYWAIFASTIVLIILIGVAMHYLGKVWAADGTPHNRTAFKVILGIAGFFLVFYGILVIILLAGSTSIATVCTVIAGVNNGNPDILDTLPVTWQTNNYGLSRQIIKYCVMNNSGDLLDFANSYTNPGYSVATAQQIKNLINGVVAYQAFINGPVPTNGSPAVNVYSAYLSTIASGITEDGAGILLEDAILSGYINSTGTVNAISTQICGIQSATTNCLRDDVLNSWSGLSSFTNANLAQPYYNNLQAYILSEQSVISNLQAQLSTGVNSVNYRYQMAANVLAQNSPNYQNIVNAIPGTLASIKLYRGGLAAYDCKSIQRELAILEDHLCFELNYWVFVLTVITAISLLLLFFLLWAIFSAARHAEGDKVIVAAMPEPAKVKDDPALDINEREIIPSM